MAGSCNVAIESRKQAASRPRPPLPRPASGSCFEQLEPVEVLSLRTTCSAQRLEQQVHDVVGQRAADEELHRQVVDALGVLALVGLLGEHPALREDVAHGAGEGLEALARRRRRPARRRCRKQVPLVERVVRPGESTGPQPYCLRSSATPSDRRGRGADCRLSRSVM